MTSDTLFAGRYRLDRRLGVGGMSTVRLAFDTRLERWVAVKMLAEHLAQDASFVSRFRREALAAARLVHPNIVQVYDFGLDDPTGRHYIVMEYVEGQSLAQILRDRERLPVAEAVNVLGQACRGLDYAHRNGVVHRDVKPGNLMRSSDGQVKLADFGIAKAREHSDITKVGSVVGTAAYLAPEQARGEPAGPGVDIYALGVVAYQTLSGRLPYEGSSLTELARQQEEGLPPALEELVPEVPAELSEAIDHALAPHPEERYPDALAFEAALNAGARGIAPDTPTAATVAGERTAATRMIAPEPRRQRPPTRETRRPLQPIEDDYGPPAYPVQDRPLPAKRRRRGARAFATLLVLVAAAGGSVGLVAYLVSESQGAVKLKQDIKGDAEQAADSLLDLIKDNTR